MSILICFLKIYYIGLDGFGISVTVSVSAKTELPLSVVVSVSAKTGLLVSGMVSVSAETDKDGFGRTLVQP